MLSTTRERVLRERARQRIDDAAGPTPAEIDPSYRYEIDFGRVMPPDVLGAIDTLPPGLFVIDWAASRVYARDQLMADLLYGMVMSVPENSRLEPLVCEWAAEFSRHMYGLPPMERI